VYRKLMMLLAVVAVLGLAIGLVGCPQKKAAAPPTPPEEAPAEEAPAEEATGE